jgi:ADP-ribose pyrophosphatase YjhB (NUDIX family)
MALMRKYPERPIVGVGGILIRGDEVLLVQRGKEPGLGEWSIPGGAVRTGETLREAVIREVLEETHLEIEPLTLVKVLERIFRDPEGRVAYHYVLVDFLCRYEGGELQPDTDARDARFVPLSDLPSYRLVPITLEVIRRAAWLVKNPGAGDPPHFHGKMYD